MGQAPAAPFELTEGLGHPTGQRQVVELAKDNAVFLPERIKRCIKLIAHGRVVSGSTIKVQGSKWTAGDGARLRGRLTRWGERPREPLFVGLFVVRARYLAPPVLLIMNEFRRGEVPRARHWFKGTMR